MIEEIKGFLGEDWLRYRDDLSESLSSDIPLLDSINKYILSNCGKQIRPMLCLLASRACGGGCIEAVKCAVSMELLHSASLLHDDVVDQADTRRGKATVGTLYNPKDAVLIGDYWLAKATEVLIKHCDTRILGVFSNCLAELARGEVLQMEKAVSLVPDYDDYVSIISNKTASLFRTAIFCGAYCSGADSTTLDALDSYAHHLGIAFQMRDDILDYHPAEITGKPSGQDILERKLTLPLLEALKSATVQESAEVLQMVRDGKVAEVTAFVRSRNGLESAQKVLSRESSLAAAALEPLADSKAKEYLILLALNLSERNV